MTRTDLSLVALHLGGNALLLWLGYYWLGIGESRALTLLWSFAVALALRLPDLLAARRYLRLLCAAAWLERALGLSTAFRTALRHLLPILAAAFAVLAVYLVVSRWEGYSFQYALQDRLLADSEVPQAGQAAVGPPHLTKSRSLWFAG